MGLQPPAISGLPVRSLLHPPLSLCPWLSHFSHLACWWWSEAQQKLILSKNLQHTGDDSVYLSELCDPC